MDPRLGHHLSSGQSYQADHQDVACDVALSPNRDLCPTGLDSKFGLCFYRCGIDLSALRMGESTRKRAEREKQAKLTLRSLPVRALAALSGSGF